ncbi:unnamed protein product [Tenebrio molitor]|nr:unnamed protein product [Tenebrio molitor]
MVSWQAVEQRGALMTRRHLQRLTEGVYHFSRRTQSTVELWYPWHYPQSPPGTCEFRRKTSTSLIAKSVIYSSIYIQITPQNMSQKFIILTSDLQDRLQFVRNNKDSIQNYKYNYKNLTLN